MVIDSSTILYLGSVQVTLGIPYSQELTGSLSIGGASTLKAESCQYLALLDNRVVLPDSWSIASGSQYATISPTGILTVLPGASGSTVEIDCHYFNLSASKQVEVTYVSGSSAETTSETEVVVDPETGQTTETTVTTTVITDSEGNETTETSTSETVTNVDGSSSQTETTEVTNPDGSSSSSSETINYDENGDVTGSSTNETVNNADGSSTSSTTNYDADGDPTDTTNVSGDVDGNVDTQEIEYTEDGDPVVTSYSIDTSGNPDGEKDITGTGVDTEFTPFTAGNGFECHIVFRTVKTEQPNPPLVVDTEDNGSNYLFNILTAKSPFKPYRGFHIRWALSKKNYSSGNLIFGYTAANASSTTSRTLYGVNDVYDITFIYDPLLQKYPSKFRVISNQGAFTTVSTNITFETNDLEFYLGYGINQEGEPYRYSNVQIYEFSLTKL